MRKGGGKQKGASFEREVCHDLSRFIDPDGDDTLFWRSAMSGGRATLHHRKGINNETQLGDITCVHERGRWLTEYFVIECKHHANLNLASSLLFGRGKLVKFWREVCEVAASKERRPLLIAKQNRTETLVVTTEAGLQTIQTFRTRRPVRVITRSNVMGLPALVCLYTKMFK